MDEPEAIEAAPAQRVVAWRGRDLFLVMLLGPVLAALLVVPLAVTSLRETPSDITFPMISGVGIGIYLGLFLTGWYVALKRRGASLRDAGFRRVDAATLLKMIPVTLGMMGINAVVIGLSATIFGDVPTAQDQVVGDATSISFQDFVWLFVLGAIAAPIVEEFIFRGLLYPLLRQRLKVVMAVVASALAFALLHLLPPLIPALLTMGVVLAVLVERYDILYPAIAVHALNNGAALVALYAAIGR